jgi:uncharacterized membrane-anchored protein YhcB (DUF1043 family)
LRYTLKAMKMALAWVRLIVCLVVCVVGGTVIADDGSDYRRAISDIESRLEAAKSYLADTRREQTDRAQDKINSALEKIAEVSLRRKAETMATDAGKIIADKLDRAARLESDMRQLQDKATGFRADDADWQPVVKAVGAAATAMVEYYKGALRDANRACRDLALGDRHRARRTKRIAG